MSNQTPGALLRSTFLTLVLVASGCGSSGQSSGFLGNSQSLSLEPVTQGRVGLVYLGQTTGTVQVQVLPMDSDTVLGSLETNSAGAFSIPAGTVLPSQFRLSVQTPEGLRVERYVSGQEQQYLFINAVSTVVSHYKRRHPELTLEEIEGRVQTGILGGSKAMYGTNDSEASPFSPSLFVSRARAGGGIEAYVESLVDGMENGQTFNFRGGNSQATFLALFRGTNAQVRPQASLLSSVGFWLLGEAAGKVTDEISYRLTGKVNSAAGTSFGSAGSFQEVSAEIGEVASMISGLESKLDNTYLKDSAVRIENKLSGDVTNIKTAMQATNTTASNAATLYQGSPNVVDHGPSSPPSGVSNAISKLDFLTSSTAYIDFQDAFTSASSSKNLCLAANAAASSGGTVSANNAPPATGSLAGGSINHISSSLYDGYDLRNDRITGPLVDNFQTNMGYLTQLATLVSESGSLALNSLPLSQAPGFAPPSLAINSGYAQILQLYGEFAHTGLAYVPQPVGSDLVLIDCKNRLMWYLPLSLGKYDAAQNGLVDLGTTGLNGWTYSNPQQKPSKVGSSVSKDLVGFQRSSDLAGWRVPEITELQVLQSQIVQAGDGSSSDASLNQGLQNLGFSGLKSLQDHSNFKKFWFNGAVYKGSNSHAGFSYFDMEKGQRVSVESVTLLDPDVDPLYTTAYVRTLNFNDSNYFGDTTQQIYKAYGQAPTLLSYLTRPIGDQSQATVIEYDQVSGYHASIQDHVTSFNQIQDWLVWTLELPANNPNDPSLKVEDIACIRYVENTGNPPPPGGSANVQLVFKRPGSVVLRATVHDPQNPNPYSIAISETSSVRPRLTSVGVSPQNVAFGTLPTSQESERYYCTGYLANGLTVDLSQKVTWARTSSYSGKTFTTGWDLDNTPPYQGLIQFNDNQSLTPINTLKATYTAGSDGGAYWSDGGQSFSDDASFAVPTTP